MQQTACRSLWLWQGDGSPQHCSLKSCSAGTCSNEHTLLSGRQLCSPFQTRMAAGQRDDNPEKAAESLYYPHAPSHCTGNRSNGIYLPVCQKCLLCLPRALSCYTVTVQESNPGLETQVKFSFHLFSKFRMFKELKRLKL